MNGGANPHIGGAAADVAAHGRVDIGIARRLVAVQQRRRRHDLPGLAVATLHHVELAPGVLNHLAHGVFADRLDGADALADHRRYRDDARAGRLAFDVHRAGAAQGHATAVLGAGEIGDVAQRPEQRHVIGHVQLMVLAIEIQGNHGLPTLF